MEIIYVFNGLGNQMSQYALYLSKKNKGQNVKCVFKDTAHNGIELERLFGVNTKNGFIFPLYNFVYGVCLTVRHQYLRFLILKILRWIRIYVQIENRNYSFNPKVLSQRKGITFYVGGWHHYRYFQENEDVIRKTYAFPAFNDVENICVKEAAKEKNAVAIHIRKGDYMDEINYNVLGKVCDYQYYKKAIERMEMEVSDPVFYIFSNDKVWAQGLMKDKKTFYVDWNHGSNSWKDMALMSEFANLIIANSTFSWWAAWLGKENKRVICPSVFIYNDLSSDIYKPSWIRII